MPDPSARNRPASPGRRPRARGTERQAWYRPGEVDCLQFFALLNAFAVVRAVKLYRLQLAEALPVPTLPCLDHEAMLHEEVAPHAAAYVEDREGSLHEIVYVPEERRIDIDMLSTMFERSPESNDRLLDALRTRLPDYTIRTIGPSWLQGDLRVMKACRAQVALRDVLTGTDLDGIEAAVERLLTISTLMEKQSRVASWGSRTVMTPLLALAGFVTYQVLATLTLPAGYQWIASLRYVVVGLLGAYFLYFGLRAVHLTQMANRVWKRSAEYGLILNERRRLARLDRPQPSAVLRRPFASPAE